MKRSTKIIGLSAAALVIAGAVGWQAFAQGPGWGGGPGYGPPFMHMMGPGFGPGGPGFGPGGPGFGRFGDPAAHLAALKEELKITPAQEPAWNAYAKTLQDTAKAMQDQHQKAFDTVKAAADKVTASLDDAQKAKAADLLPGRGGPGYGTHRPGYGPMMMHGGWWR